MSWPRFAPCENHESLQRMEFNRALDIARECPFCAVEEEDAKKKGAA
jgi:hypothetical protein